jgi:hypothetical protein
MVIREIKENGRMINRPELVLGINSEPEAPDGETWFDWRN